jgi:hypothetical protein
MLASGLLSIIKRSSFSVGSVKGGKLPDQAMTGSARCGMENWMELITVRSDQPQYPGIWSLSTYQNTRAKSQCRRLGQAAGS